MLFLSLNVCEISANFFHSFFYRAFAPVQIRDNATPIFFSKAYEVSYPYSIFGPSHVEISNIFFHFL